MRLGQSIGITVLGSPTIKVAQSMLMFSKETDNFAMQPLVDTFISLS